MRRLSLLVLAALVSALLVFRGDVRFCTGFYTFYHPHGDEIGYFGFANSTRGDLVARILTSNASELHFAGDATSGVQSCIGPTLILFNGGRLKPTNGAVIVTTKGETMVYPQ